MAEIAGIAFPDAFQMNHAFDAMMHLLEHRGPDAWDAVVYKNVQLGCRGAKIASDIKNNISVILDGHLFNNQEYRNQLLTAGCSLKAELSDAELLVTGYGIWGEEVFDKIDGSFAVAVLDRMKDVLLLARDRMGIKPLYWYYDQEYFLFGSELKSLMASNYIPQTPALDAIAAYLMFGYFPQDMTPVLQVNKLLPGNYLQYSFQKGVNIHRYWSLSLQFDMASPKSVNTISKDLDKMLADSTRNRIPHTNEAGCFISGGLGSASVAHYVKLAAEQKTVRGFTVGFQGQNDEDVEAAEICAHTLDISHTIEWISPKNFLDNFVNIVWHLDEPVADYNVIATWLLAKTASPTTNVVFSGMGSDELLAGHNRYSAAERHISYQTQLKHRLAPLFRRAFFPLFNFFSKKNAYQLLKDLRSNPWQAEYLEDNLLFQKEELASAFPALKGLYDTDILLRKFHNMSKIKSVVSSFLYIDMKTRLPDCYILQYDRLTAAHGLDWRAPFFDRGIIEYMARIPEPQSIKEFETAEYLKLITGHIFPPDLVQRPKKTRKNFLRSWLESSELKTVFQLLLQGTLIETGLVSESWLRDKLRTPESMRQSFDLLWSILVLEVWFRLYINFPLSDQAPSVSLIDFLSDSRKG